MLCLLAFTGLNANVALAEETSVPEFATIFQLSTKDQSSVAAAFTKFAQSDCRKNLPTAIRIMNENYNGADETTHSVIWNFADAADMSSTFGALRQQVETTRRIPCTPFGKLVCQMKQLT